MKPNFKKYYAEPLYRNSIAIILNSAFAALFGLLFWIVAARTMLPNEIGLATAAISAAALIVGLSKLGMDAGLIRYLPESNNKSRLYSTVIVINLVLAFVFAILFLVGIDIFSPALVFLQTGWFLPLFLLYVLVTSVFFMQNTTLVAMRKAHLSLILNLLLGLRIPILFFIAYLGVFGIFSALVFAFLVTSGSAMFMLYKHGIILTRKIDLAALRNIFKFSIGNYTAGIFTILPLTVIPIMILNTVGAKEAAYFYIAYSIAGQLFMIPNGISVSLFVEGSHNLPLKDIVIKSIRLVMTLLIPAFIIIFLFGDILLHLFSKEYSEQSFEILRFLAVSSIFASITSIYMSIKKIQKDIRMMNYVNFTISVLKIGLGYVALMEYGLIGIGYVWLGVDVLVCFTVVGMAVGIEKWISWD